MTTLLRSVIAAMAAVTLALVGASVAPANATPSYWLNAVNTERARVGLPPLAGRADLDDVAQRWSEQMASSGTLNHNPNLSSQVGNWKILGENVGVGSTESSIHQALMNSSSHRDNILDREFTEIGVGVVLRHGRYWVTQVFRLPQVASTFSGSTVTPTPPQIGTAAGKDFDRDHRVDAFGREAGTGRLWFYPAGASGAATAKVLSGYGWDMHDTLLPTDDVTGDGRADLWGRERATGTLWLYTGDGTGSFSTRRPVGTGWQMHDALFTAGDVTGDGRADLWGRERATGTLWLYTGDGTGSFSTRRPVGTGWQMHDALLTAGDVTGDGRADLWGRERATGTLWLYTGDGTGSFSTRRPVGTGWQMHDALIGAQDIDGDGRADVSARERATGNRWLYSGDGSGGFVSRRVLDGGWNTVDALF